MYFSGYLGHQYVMVYPVKELGYVDVHYPSSSFCHVFTGLLKRLMSTASFSEAIASFRELDIKSAFYLLNNGLLNDSIYNSWNPKLSCASVWFGNGNSQYRKRMIDRGLVQPRTYGKVRYTLPLFDKFIEQTQNPNSEFFWEINY